MGDDIYFNEAIIHNDAEDFLGLVEVDECANDGIDVLDLMNNSAYNLERLRWL